MTATTAAPAGILSRIEVWCDDRLNPVLVKDVRASLRSKVFLFIFFFGLALAQLATVTCTLITHSSRDVGFDLYFAIILGMAFLLTGLIPYLMQARFSEELASRSTELALISRLTPAGVINGKIQTAIAHSLLYFAAAGPSIAVAYLLGGFDLILLSTSLVMLAFFSCMGSALAVVLVALRKEKPIRLVGILCLGQGVLVTSIMGGVLQELRRSSTISDQEFWIGFGAAGLIITGIVLFFYTVAISRLSFETENRDMRPRLALSLLSFGIVGVITLAIKLESVFRGTSHWWSLGDIQTFAGVMAGLAAFVIGVLFLLDTSDRISMRVRREWPRLGILRTAYCPGLGRIEAYILFHMIAFFLLGFLQFGGVGHLKYDAPWFAATTVLMAFVLLGAPISLDDVLASTWLKFLRTWNRSIIVATLIVVWCTMALAAYIVAKITMNEDLFLLCSPFTALFYYFDWPPSLPRVITTTMVYLIPACLVLADWYQSIKEAIAENGEIAAEQARLIALESGAPAEMVATRESATAISEAATVLPDAAQ